MRYTVTNIKTGETYRVVSEMGIHMTFNALRTAASIKHKGTDVVQAIREYGYESFIITLDK